MFSKIYLGAKLIAVLCVVPITIYLCLFLNSLRAVTVSVAGIPALVDSRIGKLQTDTFAKIDTVQDKLNATVTDTRQAVLGEVSSLATTADTRIDKLTTTTDNRIGSLQKDVIGTVNTTGTEVLASVDKIQNNMNGQLTTANASLTQLSSTYSSVPAILGSRFNRFINCDTNELCLQNQLSDTMFAARTASRSVDSTMVSVNTNVPIFMSNMNGITANIKKLTTPHWYDRLLGYGVSGLTIYRDLNPATNFVATVTNQMVKH